MLAITEWRDRPPPLFSKEYSRYLLAVLISSLWALRRWVQRLGPKQMDLVACGRGELLHKIHHWLMYFARITAPQINQSLKRIRRCFIEQVSQFGMSCSQLDGLPSQKGCKFWFSYLPSVGDSSFKSSRQGFTFKSFLYRAKGK